MQRCFVTTLITGIYESTCTRRRAQVGVGRLVNLLVLRNRQDGRPQHTIGEKLRWRIDRLTHNYLACLFLQFPHQKNGNRRAWRNGRVTGDTARLFCSESAVDSIWHKERR